MYYSVISVMTMPGKRFAGIDHLEKHVTFMTRSYGVTTEVLGNAAGRIYQNPLVYRFESMARYEEVMETVVQSEDFQAWFSAGEDLLEWQESTPSGYTVL